MELTKKEQEMLNQISANGQCDEKQLAQQLDLVPQYVGHRIKLLKLKGFLDDTGKPILPTHTVADVTEKAINKDEPIHKNETPIVDIIDSQIDLKELIPKKDSTYKYRNGVDDVIKKFAVRNIPLFLIGEAGSGKTWAIRQFASDSNLPFLRVACDDSAVLKEYIGKREIINGNTIFRMGLLVQMVQTPSVILIDEFNALPASKLFFLHELLDTRKLFIKDAGSGLVVNVHPDCKIFLACNPNNSKYAGTNKVNVALADRGGYLSVPNFKTDEMHELFDCGNNNTTSALKKFYEESHRVIRDQNLRVAFSLRAIKRISTAIVSGDSIEDALQHGFYNSALLTATIKEREALRQIARVCFGPDKIK